ncbi:MAG: cyclic pyranopterin monophosphate synthase MoaC [Planctomycetota bacterium]
MVDVTAKAPGRCAPPAPAPCWTAAPTTVRALRRGRGAERQRHRGGALAGIQAVKWTAHLIPLCHPLHRLPSPTSRSPFRPSAAWC